MSDRPECYEVHEPQFWGLIQGNAHLRKLATGFEWTEGPVWFPAAQVMLFSDIPANRMMRLTMDGTCTTFRQPSMYSNGNTRDPQGRLVSCHHGARAVSRTEHDGTLTILADSHDGKRLNSPNDVVVKSDGAVYFTDPTYGILSDYEGYRADPEQAARHVFRIDPDSDEIVPVISDFTQPNGLAFSPDEHLLYVAESGSSHDPDVPSIIRVFDVAADGTMSGGDTFCTIDAGLPDGFRVDTDGRIWCSAADGVHCFDAQGALLGKILVPEVVSNLCFGGERGNRLLITGTTSVYSVPVNARSAEGR